MVKFGAVLWTLARTISWVEEYFLKNSKIRKGKCWQFSSCPKTYVWSQGNVEHGKKEKRLTKINHYSLGLLEAALVIQAKGN